MADRWAKVPANTYGFRVPGWMNNLNNMPEINITDFVSVNAYLVDDVDRGQGVVQDTGSAGAVEHERRCNAIHDLFSNVFTDCTVHSLRTRECPGKEQFKQKIAVELAKYTARDLVIFYFHGKAGGKDDEYTWYFYQEENPIHLTDD